MPNVATIRALFLDPRPVYTVAEVASLLAMTEAEVRGWIESGEMEAIETAGGEGVPWDEVVSFGIEHWSQEVVEQALGADALDLIPELVRLTDLQVRIPQIQVVTLERLAALDGESVSTVVARELRDLVSVHAPWLSIEVPGFAANMSYA